MEDQYYAEDHKIIEQIREAMRSADTYKVDEAIDLLYISDRIAPFIDLINDLLLFPHHHRHQEITRLIQQAQSASSIEFIRKALLTNFDYLQYTCSDDGPIAKWFSHALFDIGTEEAINVIREFAQSPNEEIRFEMNYRLEKTNQKAGL
ncbi:MAG TPA: hypothetical protein VK174_04990 [Chitinophagales bacterium]|nr:hypothetical protein [Chitinophagales bacterium]